MKIVLATLMLFTLRVSVAANFSLVGYQGANGEILTHYRGTEVDPYFALKALLIAQGGGLDVRDAMERFVSWLLPRQADDGRIHRFKRVDGLWKRAAYADADDSLLALWIQSILLVEKGKPLHWGTAYSLYLAEAYLERLFDKRRGVYRVFVDDATALYMDNVEILAASREIARLYAERGDVSASARWAKRGKGLARAIVHVFPGTEGLSPTVSTQTDHRPTGNFYPDRVAAVFGWLHDFPRQDNSLYFAAWLAHNASAWKANSAVDYPWGLVALEASRAGAAETARDWLAESVRWRHGPRWNVLEEAVVQVLQHRLGNTANP